MVKQDRPWFRFWPEVLPQHLDYPVIPVFQLLSRAAREHPESTAFTFRDRELSYQELDELTSKLAVGLHNLGIRTGDSE